MPITRKLLCAGAAALALAIGATVAQVAAPGPDRIIVRIVAADMPDRLISDVEALAPVEDPNVNTIAPRPQFKTTVSRADGSLGFQLTLNPGVAAALEFSTDFTNWTTLQMFTPATNTLERIEPKPMAPAGYFRLRQN